MHDVSDSASSVRDRKRSLTTRELIRAARLLTAEHGLPGFTVQELCDAAAVSRRTFFNYFASKEDAVLGLPLERADVEAVATFLRGGAPDSSDISPTLLRDLATLNEIRWRAMDVLPETISDLMAAVEREPRLLSRMLDHAIGEEELDTRLIEQRENLPAGDPRARVAASILASISRISARQFFEPGNTDSFHDIFEAHVTASRELFATQNPLIGWT